MYVLNELVAYCMVTMTFAGLGFALQEEKLIRVGFVLNLFGESRFWTRTLELTNFFAAAVALSFFEYYLVLSASRDFWRGTNSGTMLETPKWLPQSIAALMIFVFLWLLLTRIVGLLMMFIRDRRGGIAT